MSEYDPPVYDLKSVKLPYLAGATLQLLVKILESPARAILTPKLLKDAGVKNFRELKIDEPPTYYPLHNKPQDAGTRPLIRSGDWQKIAMQAPRKMPWPSVQDYVSAYRKNAFSPVDVAENVLAAIAASNATDPPLRAVISNDREDVLKQAEASAERLQKGKARSVLEGVPVAVKDELDLAGYPTEVGTSFLGRHPAGADATIVARLRAAGAVLIGKTNMHEIGIGVTGLNPHHGTARNPYNPKHYTGGSSSGSAAAVASGLCPIAVGADGGGSIRIPSAFCGLVGLKSTFGRVSEFGAATLVWSVAHNGALANNAADAALAYAIMAGPDPQDPLTLKQPSPTLEDWTEGDLSNLKLGVYWPWFRHATAEVVSVCEALLDQFQKMGAETVEIRIPELEPGRVAHLVSIAAEMTQALERHYAAHRKDYGLDVRLNLALARQFTARDFLQAQRVRTRMMRHFQNAFESVDVIVTPSTGVTAPEIPAKALPNGDSDLSLATEIMRFAAPANLTGLPAISFPAGYTKAGLPVGLQAMAGAWQEHLLLRLALAAERTIEKRKPLVFYEIFPQDKS